MSVMSDDELGDEGTVGDRTTKGDDTKRPRPHGLALVLPGGRVQARSGILRHSERTDGQEEDGRTGTV